MKLRNSYKIIVLAILFTAALSSLSAAPRKVLVEEFTNASCGPCAQLNPDFIANLKTHLDDCIPIIYHVSWPGSDEIYSADPTLYDLRVDDYGITGVPHAIVGGNAYSGMPYVASVETGIQKVLAKGASPLTIDINYAKNGNKLNVFINATTTQSVQGKTMKIAVCEAYHFFDQAGTNGEKNFYYVVRTMLPDVFGEDFSVDPSSSATFSHEINYNPEWYEKMLYVVAFVQDDISKEVLQAASSPIPSLTNIEQTPQLTLNVTSDEQYFNVMRSKSNQHKVTITNPNNIELDVRLSVYDSKSYIPSGWKAQMDQTVVKIPAKGSIDANLVLTTTGTAAYCIPTVEALPLNVPDNNFQKPGLYQLGALSENTKYAIYLDYNSAFANLYLSAMYQTTYFADAAVIPFNSQTIQVFPPKNFDAALFSVSWYSYNSGYVINGDMLNSINDMVNNGKSVFITSEGSGWYAFESKDALDGKTKPNQDFFNNVLGISLAPNGAIKPRIVVQNQQYVLSPFQITGIADDPVSTGINVTGNTDGRSYVWKTDIFKLAPQSIAEPCFYLDNDPNSLGGVRVEMPNDAKIVYLSFGLEAIYDNSTRNKIVKNAFDWFTGVIGSKLPKIAVNETILNYDETFIGNSQDKTVTVKIEGEKALNITNVRILSDPDQSFRIMDDLSLPLVLLPNDSKDIQIRFEPKAEQDYSSSLEFVSNDKNNPSQKVSLKGTGKIDTEVPYGLSGEGSEIKLSANPNPIRDKSLITFTVKGNHSSQAKVFVIDELGNEVTVLLNGDVFQGDNKLEFNAAGLSSGLYFIVAHSAGQSVQFPVSVMK
ncbi:MAG: Choice-of-anchor protein [Bacteroidota bacterium]|nr:Choice-of-anchor protein [Bacteroidota bacterium]